MIFPFLISQNGEGIKINVKPINLIKTKFLTVAKRFRELSYHQCLNNNVRRKIIQKVLENIRKKNTKLL